MDQQHKLTPDTGSMCSDPGQYRGLVGRLLYLTITRPDISYAVHVLSQFMHAPRQPHLDAALQVLRYLKGAPGEEAEYRAMATTSSEIIWLVRLLQDLHVPCTSPVSLFCDNQAAIHIAANPCGVMNTGFSNLAHLAKNPKAVGIRQTVPRSLMLIILDPSPRTRAIIRDNIPKVPALEYVMLDPTNPYGFIVILEQIANVLNNKDMHEHVSPVDADTTQDNFYKLKLPAQDNESIHPEANSNSDYINKLVCFALAISMASYDETITLKPEKFNGQNFKRWQRQMKYWLTVLGFISAIEENNSQSRESSSWYTPEQIEFHCHNRILSALSDRLYDVYHATKSAKELWNLLQGEYGIDDAGIERFNASTFNKFVMVEGKAISDQIHEFQDHLRTVEENGSKFSEDYKCSRYDSSNDSYYGKPCLKDRKPIKARGLRRVKNSEF
ncbi:hypothetical protein RJ639_014726 [Escallonia herrerae]|uniref:Uncharacterized protein n=1 Tax=Escallonia herrerae TaxID=1293975 RepID=A0AA88VQ40_9ASTE|nr:hypothetical protein RJ639_014726 [Escallonia herrerae]